MNKGEIEDLLGTSFRVNEERVGQRVELGDYDVMVVDNEGNVFYLDDEDGSTAICYPSSPANAGPHHRIRYQVLQYATKEQAAQFRRTDQGHS